MTDLTEHYPALSSALDGNEPAQRDLQFLLDSVSRQARRKERERVRPMLRKLNARVEQAIDAASGVEPVYCVEGAE
jgi:hypothetical protein